MSLTDCCLSEKNLYTVSMSFWFSFLGLWLMIAGLVIVVGSVNVMDWISWLARRSGYWTEAAIRTHKVTKPLDWAGAGLAFVGGLIFYRHHGLSGMPLLQLTLWVMLCLNGAWLSFAVSPELLRREKTGRSTELLPDRLQRKITTSFMLSVIGWWTEISLLVWFIVTSPVH